MLKEEAAIQLVQQKLADVSNNVPEATDDIHELFVYFIGELYEGVSPTDLKVCDKAGDQKIDFYVSSDERFVCYQCKCPDLDNLEKDARLQNFGQDLINEAEDILTFLTDTSGAATGNECSQTARNIYRRALQR